MLAFILHIKKEHQGLDEPNIIDDYSVWCTERQAYCNAGKYLIEECKDWGGQALPSYLKQTIIRLIETEEVKLAIQLLNGLAEGMPPLDNRIPKFNIKIIRSDFRGSPFE